MFSTIYFKALAEFVGILVLSLGAVILLPGCPSKFLTIRGGVGGCMSADFTLCSCGGQGGGEFSSGRLVLAF